MTPRPPRFREGSSVCLVVTLIVSALLTPSAPLAAQNSGLIFFEPTWTFELPGWNRSSSPVIADIDGDGQNEIVFGHQDGKLRAYEGDGTLKWMAEAIPGLDPSVCNSQSSGSAIDSSPAVADIDGDGNAEVLVGVGSTWVPNQNGSVISFDGQTGAIEWSFNQSRDEFNVWNGSPRPDGWCEGTFSTPAIGDIDGDGNLDVVFGSWDFYIWAVDSHGIPLPGFPVNNDDTVWSSPALFDVDGDNDMEIFVGGDSTPFGYVDHLGGIFRAIDYRNGAPVPLWDRKANEVFHSSPAIGDINGDGRPEVITGMGNNWHIECGERNNPACSGTDGTDHVKVWAFHLDDGSNVPGWPRSTGGSTLGSPALGDVDADGLPEVVIGSFDHKVYAWNGDGSLAWSSAPRFGHFGTSRVTGSPIIADLDGDGDQDVAVGSDFGLALLDGRDGSPLSNSVIGYSHETAPAVDVINGSRHIVFTGFDTPKKLTLVSAYKLPPTTEEDAWPMYRHSAARRGVVRTLPCGGYLEFATRFCDVANGFFYTDAVVWTVENGITIDVLGQLLEPTRPLTRAEMVAFLWREEGDPVGYPNHGFGYPNHGFIDVPTNAYYANAVRWAKATEVTTGTSQTTFSPNDNVTRGQIVTLLWRKEGKPVGYPNHGFIDVPTNAYYANAVRWAKATDVTTGTSPTAFSPDDSVTRAQAVTFLYRVAGSPG